MGDQFPSFKEMGLCSGNQIKMQEVCQAANRSCALNPTWCFTNQQLVSLWGNAGPTLLTPEQLREERRTLLRHLYEKFMTMKNTPTYAETCCGSNLRCLRNFSQVRLKTTANAQSFFSSITNEIFLSERLLVDLSSHHSLDRVLLHEMGHACQYARANGISYIVLELKLRPLHVEERDFRKTFSEATWSCLRQKHRTWKKDPLVNAPSRLREAFANGIFASEMKSVFHWHSPCHVKSDASHANPVEYMDCFFQDHKVREKLCS